MPCKMLLGLFFPFLGLQINTTWLSGHLAVPYIKKVCYLYLCKSTDLGTFLCWNSGFKYTSAFFASASRNNAAASSSKIPACASKLLAIGASSASSATSRILLLHLLMMDQFNIMKD